MDNYSEDFRRVFTSYLRDLGRWRDPEPAALSFRWNAFVADCERGYGGDFDEYVNDRTSRSDLERAFNAPELQSFAELDELRAEVEAADARFRAILQPDAFPKVPEERWWVRGMVRYGGRRLVDSLKGHVDIELVS